MEPTHDSEKLNESTVISQATRGAMGHYGDGDDYAICTNPNHWGQPITCCGDLNPHRYHPLHRPEPCPEPGCSCGHWMTAQDREDLRAEIELDLL